MRPPSEWYRNGGTRGGEHGDAIRVRDLHAELLHRGGHARDALRRAARVQQVPGIEAPLTLHEQRLLEQRQRARRTCRNREYDEGNAVPSTV